MVDRLHITSAKMPGVGSGDEFVLNLMDKNDEQKSVATFVLDEDGVLLFLNHLLGHENPRYRGFMIDRLVDDCHVRRVREN